MKRFSSLLLFFIILPIAAESQLIDVRTYPILSDNTVFALPQRYQGMGGVSIGLRDEYLAPFINPATIMLSSRRFASAMPRWSSWDYRQQRNDQGSSPSSGYTSTNGQSASNLETTVGAVTHNEYFGFAGLINYQSVKSKTLTEYGSTGYPATKSETSFGASNFPFFIATSALIPGTPISVGVAYSAMDLKGFDGVQILYPGSKTIEISGSAQDVRAGVVSPVGQTMEVELLGGRSTTSDEQKATYDYSPPLLNKEDTKTTFAQLTLRAHVTENLQIGFSALGNWTDMPKLPNYPVAGVPRDPGTIVASNIGVGLSWKAAPTVLFAADVILEPIKTDTWVEAQADRLLPDSTTLPKGSVEQRNNYKFWNQLVRAGVELQAADWFVLRFGSSVHFYSYDYYFKSYVWNQERTRTPQLQWTEATLTGGFTAQWRGLQLSYSLEYLHGRGILDAHPPLWYLMNDQAIILVPNDWTVVKPVPVFAHQISLSYLIE